MAPPPARLLSGSLLFLWVPVACALCCSASAILKPHIIWIWRRPHMVLLPQAVVLPLILPTAAALASSLPSRSLKLCLFLPVLCFPSL